MSYFKNKEHVFFDLDHTLWDFDTNSGVVFENIFKQQDFSFTTQDFLAHYIPINQSYWKLYQQDKITHDELRFGRLNDVFVHLNSPISKEKVNEISEHYIALLPEANALFDGTIEILDYLQTKYKLHIITNGFHFVQDKKIKNAKIDHYFQTVTNSELAKAKKPSSVIFDYAIQLAAATKENSVMIGDSIEADVEGALNYGMDAIYFSTIPSEHTKPIHQVSHLLELKNFL